MKEKRHYEDISKAPLLENTKISSEVAKAIIDPLQDKGYPTQYASLNENIGGLKHGSFIVIGAEQGRGKSIFALNLLLEQCRNGIKSCYVDIENGEPQTWKRLMMINYQLDSATIMGMTVGKIKKLAGGIENFSYYNESHIARLVTESKPKRNVILDLIRQRIDDGYKVFVIDPFSRFCEDDANNELHEEGIFAGHLADLAREKEICIIAVHHLRKGNQNKRVQEESEIVESDYAVPTLESFRGSSKIIDRATEVIGIIRFPKQTGADIVNMRILKARTGRTGHFFINFDKVTLTFVEPFIDPIKRLFGEAAEEIT